MAFVSNIIARIGANIKPLQQGLSTAQRSVSSFQKTMNSQLKNVAGAMTVFSGAYIAGLGLVAKNTIQTAMTFESSLNQIARIMGKSSIDFMKWVDTQALAFNMSKADAVQYGATFGNLLSSISNDTSKISKYTQELLKASAIVASGTGRDIVDVMERIRSGLLGNTEAIEDLGIYVNVAMLESSDAFKKFAGNKSWDKLSFQTQQQIRLFAILEQSVKKYGTTVNTSTSSSLAKLAAILKDVNLQLGEVLLPIIQELIPVFMIAANGIKSLVNAFSKLNPTVKYLIVFGAIAAAVIVPILAAVAGFVALVTAAFAELTATILIVAGVAILAFAAIGGIFSSKISEKAKSMVESLNEKVKQFAASTSGAKKEQSKLGDEVKDTTKAVKGALMPFDEINQITDELSGNTDSVAGNLDSATNSLNNILPNGTDPTKEKNNLFGPVPLKFPPIEPPTIPPADSTAIIESLQNVIDKINELIKKRDELTAKPPIVLTVDAVDNATEPLNNTKKTYELTLNSTESSSIQWKDKQIETMKQWQTSVAGAVEGVKLNLNIIPGTLEGVQVGSNTFATSNVGAMQGWSAGVNTAVEATKATHSSVVGTLAGVQAGTSTFATDNKKTIGEWSGDVQQSTIDVKNTQSSIVGTLNGVQLGSDQFKKDNVKTFQNWQKDTKEPITTWTIDTSTGFAGWVNNVVGNFKTFANKAVTSISDFSKNAWAAISNWLVGTADGVYTWVKSTFGQIVTWGKSVFKVIDDLASTVGQRISNSVSWTSDLVVAAYKGIGNWADKNKDWLIPLGIGAAAVGAVATGIVTAPVAATAAGVAAAVSMIPNLVPQMATGGIVTGPTLAMVGEGNGPEAVLPLTGGYVEELGGMIASSIMQVMQMGNGQGKSGDIVLQIDGTQFARIINPYQAKESQRIGNKVIIQGV